MISIVLWIVFCVWGYAAPKPAPVVCVDEQQGMSCLAADEEDLLLLRNALEEPQKPPSSTVEVKPQARALKPVAAAPVPKEPAPTLPHTAKLEKKLPRMRKLTGGELQAPPAHAFDDEDLEMSEKEETSSKKLLSVETWLGLKTQEQKLLDDIKKVDEASQKFITMSKDIARVREKLDQERIRLVESGWNSEDLPFPQVLGDDEEGTTLEDLEDQENVLLGYLKGAAVGGGDKSAKQIRRLIKTLKVVRAKKALFALNHMQPRQAAAVRREPPAERKAKEAQTPNEEDKSFVYNEERLAPKEPVRSMLADEEIDDEDIIQKIGKA